MWSHCFRRIAVGSLLTLRAHCKEAAARETKDDEAIEELYIVHLFLYE